MLSRVCTIYVKKSGSVVFHLTRTSTCHAPGTEVGAAAAGEGEGGEGGGEEEEEEGEDGDSGSLPRSECA